MRTIPATMMLFAVMLFTTPGFGQEVERQGQRYIFVGAGAWPAELGPDPLMSAGVGGERQVRDRLGMGVELQAFVQPKNGRYYGGGTVSANGTYHFRSGAHAQGKVSPFGTGGFSAVLLCAGQCWPTIGFNFGGGINCWRTAGHGIRVEFRDTVTQDYAATHLWEVRSGFSF